MSPHAIVVGGGHNGLVAACYLARAGRDVLLLEARDSVGGCVSTVEMTPGVRVNICSCDHSMIRGSGIIEELGLEEFGLSYLDAEPIQLSLTEGHDPWWTYFEVERTTDELATVHPGQACEYERYIADALPMAKLLRRLASSPLTFARGIHAALDAGGTTARRILAWGKSTPLAVLSSYFSSDAVIAPALLTGPSVWGVSPNTPGTGLAALTLAFKHVQRPGRPVGGSGALTDALAAALVASGGAIRTKSFVEAVIYDGAGVRGVRLADGGILESQVVVAAVAPQRLAYLSRAMVPRQMGEWTAAWARSPKPDGYEAKLDVVVSEPPRVRGVSYEDLDSPSRALAASGVIAPSVDGIAAAYAAYRSGRVHEAPLLYFNSPSAADDQMKTSSGDHLVSIEVLFTPYDLAGGWAASSEPHRWLERFARFVEPGFLDSVRSFAAMTPPRYEQEFFLERGHVPSFPDSPVAALLGRRNRSLSRHSTPIDGLFLSGGATFPGAGVWGASGRNAARVALAARTARFVTTMSYDLAKWLVEDLGDSVARLEGQVLGCVPPGRRKERADGGGNSINWTAFDSRHAALALAVVGATLPLHPADDLDAGAGLDESEPGWASELDSATVEAETIAIFMRVRSYLGQVDPAALTGLPDVDRVFEERRLDRGDYGWLYAMWAGKPLAWFVRWPLTGDLTNHVGEMIATRNRLGLSPF